MESGVQEILGLVSTHWWVRPGPGDSAGPLVGRGVSWGLAAVPRGPRAGAGLLVDKAQAQLVPGLYWPARGWAESCQGGLWASGGPGALSVCW